jgi:hypothetical protein
VRVEKLACRDRMRVFHSRDVAAQQARPLLDVSLGEAPGLPKMSDTLSYVHRSATSVAGAAD